MFTQTMPLLFAGGVCCAVLAFAVAPLAGAGVVAGLLAEAAAGALLDAGAGADLLAGEALAAGAAAGVAAVESAEVVFFDLLFLVVMASVFAAGVPDSAFLLAAALSVASGVFFDRDFVRAVSAPVLLLVPASTLAVLLVPELSAASAALAFLEVVFLGVAVVLSDAAAPALAVDFFLDLEVVVFAESAVASALL